jgi:hypothetical protein
VQSGTVFVGGGAGVGCGVRIGLVSELEEPPPLQLDSKINDKKITLFLSLFRNGSI